MTAKKEVRATRCEADYVVVGAGVSGLFVAVQVKRRLPRLRVHVYEARRAPGGRVQTVRDERTGAPLYERGAWRVAAHHRRAVALYAHYGIRLSAASHSRAGAAHVLPGTNPARDAAELSGEVSLWDAVAKGTDVPTAQRDDRDTGYMGLTEAAATTAVYGVGALAASGTGSAAAGAGRGGSADKEPDYLVPAAAGMDAVIHALVDDALRLGVRLYLKHRVTDLRLSERSGLYACSVGWLGEDGSQGRKVVTSAHVCIAVPPAAARSWSLVRERMLPLTGAVVATELMHVWARSRTRPAVVRGARDIAGNPNFKIVLGASPLAQVISGDYDGQRIFQVSYSGGQAARYWLNRWQALGSTDALRREVVDRLRTDAGGLLNVGAADVDDVYPCYYAHAVHMWRPAPSFDPDRASRASVVPLAHAGVDTLTWTGEAFSTVQAWIEGALQQAERALHAALAALHRAGSRRPGRVIGRAAATPPPVPADCVRIYGYDVPVAEFAQTHPGGAEALAPYVGTDATEVFQHIGHSDTALAFVYALWSGSRRTRH